MGPVCNEKAEKDENIPKMLCCMENHQGNLSTYILSSTKKCMLVQYHILNADLPNEMFLMFLKVKSRDLLVLTL